MSKALGCFAIAISYFDSAGRLASALVVELEMPVPPSATG